MFGPWINGSVAPIVNPKNNGIKKIMAPIVNPKNNERLKKQGSKRSSN